MRLLEYQGKEILKSGGIPVPAGMVISYGSEQSTENLATNASGFSVEKGIVAKAQVPVGGRGKAGGIKIAGTITEAGEYALAMLGSTLKGHPVNAVLLEEAIDITREIYMSYVLNDVTGEYFFLFSDEGGMDIEELVQKNPEKVIQRSFSLLNPPSEYRLRNILLEAGLQAAVLKNVTDVAWALWKLMVQNDLLLAEINPLVIRPDNSVVAADAKVEVDDNALFRHPNIRQWSSGPVDPLEARAKDIGVTFVGLEGDIGIVASGAGLAMNTMDLVKDFGFSPANFLETGGGITAKLMSDAVQLVCGRPNIRGLIVNLYGGVNPLIAAAQGVVDGIGRLDRNIPVVVKALGNQQDDCWKILEEANIPVIKSHKTEEAVQQLAARIGRGLQ